MIVAGMARSVSPRAYAVYAPPLFNERNPEGFQLLQRCSRGGFPNAGAVIPALAKAAHYRGLVLVQQLKTGANRDTEPLLSGEMREERTKVTTPGLTQ
jgi:hypothetical protein